MARTWKSRGTEPKVESSKRLVNGPRDSGSPTTSPSPSGSASDSRRDPAKSKMQEFIDKGRPTDPAKQREYDLWANILEKSKKGYEKGKTMSGTATELGAIPEGAVMDPTRGVRYADAPRGTPLDEREITHANWRMPQDPNQTNISPDDGRKNGGKHTLERFGPAQGYRPINEPYFDEQSGTMYQDYYDDHNDRVVTLPLNVNGTPNLTPPTTTGQNNMGPQTKGQDRIGQGSEVADRIQGRSGAMMSAPEAAAAFDPRSGLSNLGMMDPMEILEARRARRAHRNIGEQEALNTGIIPPKR